MTTAAVKSQEYDTTLLADSGPRATPRAADSHRWVGTRVDHFDIEAPLAQGGMGAVYRGWDCSLERKVAIKVLPDDLADHPELQERFVREARAQARLQSPHVVHIYYVGRTPATHQQRGRLYFAMELVEGGALEDALAGGQVLDPERARLAMLQVARGLRDAQRAGIIHRDIKPSNLLVDKNGDVKIADFGVAKPIDSTDSAITRDGAVVGSPLYMPPEQARGETLDHRTDMYSVGASFYHLLTGAPPFEGPTALAVISKHLAEPPRPITELAPEVPAKLAQVVSRLLAKSPDDRFDDYDELISALHAAAPEAAQYGGFWARGAAVGIDVVLAGTVVGFVGWPGLAAHLVYVTAGHALFGRTLGKHLMKLCVTRTDGSRLGWGRSLARTVISLWLPFLIGALILLTEGHSELTATIERLHPTQITAFQDLLLAIAISHGVLSLLFVAGLLLAAFDRQKRAAHDLVTGSIVRYRLAR